MGPWLGSIRPSPAGGRRPLRTDGAASPPDGMPGPGPLARRRPGVAGAGQALEVPAEHVQRGLLGPPPDLVPVAGGPERPGLGGAVRRQRHADRADRLSVVLLWARDPGEGERRVRLEELPRAVGHL